MLVEKNFVGIYENVKELALENSVKIELPSGTATNLIESLNTTSNGSVVIGASAYSTIYNPFKNIKKNANISTSLVINSTNATNNYGAGLNNVTIMQIYNDFKKDSSKNSPIIKNLETPILQLSFKPFIYENDGKTVSLDQTIGIGQYSENKTFAYTLPLISNITNVINETLILPFWYDNEEEQWRNENCALDAIDIIKSKITARCNHAGKKGIHDLKDTFALSVDIIKDVYKIITQGNYKQLAEISALLALSQRNIIAFSVVVLAYVIVIGAYIMLSYMDKHDIYISEAQCLSKYFNKETKIIQTGMLYNIMSFFSFIKKLGAKNTSKSLQNTIKPPKTQPTQAHLDTESAIVTKHQNKNILQSANGFSVLSKSEKNELWDLYQMYAQCSRIFDTPAEIEEVMSKELSKSSLIVRMTQYYIDDIILLQPVTFWILLKNEHPLLNAVMKAEITTPRPIKLLIFFCTFVGELFITGYFSSTTQETTKLEIDSSAILSRSLIYSLAAAGLMIPLKIFISAFMTGTNITKNMTRGEIMSNESLRPILKIVGTVLGFLWLTGCLYGIMMYIITYAPESIDIWMIAFAISVLIELIFMAQLKVFIKVMIGLLLMRLLRSRIMLTASGIIAGFIVEWVVAIL